ncbi:TetR family transcriptional regulator [Nonomuraea composti]|uniref:TetR/AcrR family transcriptional regulator n=1 Tax=Nonomuraea composti TaxID=2720023 RepID=UPI003204AD64
MRRSSRETKALILAAARERFAADGYDRTTIRAIAGQAHIDPAMIIRYFASKEDLFLAACAFDVPLPDPAGIPREKVGATLVEFFLRRWEADAALHILLRGATSPLGAERLRSVFAAEIVPLAATWCDDPVEAARRAALASTQILGLALCRFVAALPPMADMTHEELVTWVGPTVQRYLVSG